MTRTTDNRMMFTMRMCSMCMMMCAHMNSLSAS